MLRGDWLWSGNGMMDAHTPRIIDGWISQCVYLRAQHSRTALLCCHVYGSAARHFHVLVCDRYSTYAWLYQHTLFVLDDSYDVSA